MSRIRSKDTGPEMKLRRLLHGLGWRYRLHVRDLPGCPDLVFPKLTRVIFVHGCFWHMHRCRYGLVIPRTNAAFWQAKRDGNSRRDRKALRELRKHGWKALVVWECQLRNQSSVEQRVVSFLTAPAVKNE